PNECCPTHGRNNLANMKILREKKVKKILAFYKNYFKFRTPYQVLVDGTFCLAALNSHLDINEDISRYFHSEIRLFTTSCVIAEAHNLEKLFPGLLQQLRNCQVCSCGHKKKAMSVADCLKSMVDNRNKCHYIIGTQDKKIQDVLRKIAGVAIIFIDRTICIEQPSNVSQLVKAEGFDGEKMEMNYEENVLNLLKEKILDKKPRVELKKKKLKKGANPLSCKKRKTVTSVPSTEQGVKKGRKRRKKCRISSHIKEILKNSQTEDKPANTIKNM
ncbi:rRNA-processing protein UTP23 homolog, partial [Argonauta hians]